MAATFAEKLAAEAVTRRDDGALVADPLKLARLLGGGFFTRYNGGWVRRVTDLETFEGSQMPEGSPVQMQPGIYLDCSIGGSRKAPRATYTLFALLPDGSGKRLGSDHLEGWQSYLRSLLTDDLRQLI